MITRFALAAAAVFAFASLSPAPARAAEEPPHTAVKVKETPKRRYLCVKKELKLAEMKEWAPKAVTALVEHATEKKILHGGPVVIFYHGFQGDPEQTFTAEMGLPIAGEAEKSGEIYAREVGQGKVASAIFQGPLAKIGEAWASFVPQAMAKGEPTMESREVYLQFEGHASANNIVELQMVLK